MTSLPDQQTRESRFVESLYKLAGRNLEGDELGRPDRGALAALRRGLGRAPGEAAEMHRYVVPFLLNDERDDWRFYLVASLFATHQEQWPAEDMPRWRRERDRNLGASFAQLRAKRSDGEQGVERRFTALLSTRQEDLPDHLRHGVSLLKTERVPVDYLQLLRDLRWWDAEDRGVQRRWARAFWAAMSAGTTQSGETENAASDADTEQQGDESENDQ